MAKDPCAFVLDSQNGVAIFRPFCVICVIVCAARSMSFGVVGSRDVLADSCNACPNGSNLMSSVTMARFCNGIC